jgi:hypothetical protein
MLDPVTAYVGIMTILNAALIFGYRKALAEERAQAAATRRRWTEDYVCESSAWRRELNSLFNDLQQIRAERDQWDRMAGDYEAAIVRANRILIEAYGDLHMRRAAGDWLQLAVVERSLARAAAAVPPESIMIGTAVAAIMPSAEATGRVDHVAGAGKRSGIGTSIGGGIDHRRSHD